MDKKQYLNEEIYQKNKRKITIVAMLVLVFGLSIGVGLISIGLIKNQQSKLSFDEKNKIQLEMDGYNNQLASLKAQQNKEVRENGFSEKYYLLDNQIDKLEDKVDDLEDKLDPETSYLVVFYIFGGFIVFAILIISSSIYTTAKGREISAFFAQQQMPVGMESIDEMTPTVANSAEKIFRGIKKGLKDDEE